MNSRLIGMVAKEFIHLKRDPFSVTLALFIPVIMLFIFGVAINTDVKHISTVVIDRSNTLESRTLIDSMSNSQYFNVKYVVLSETKLTSLIDGGEAKVGVVIPPDYAKRLARRKAYIQVIVDATDPMVASSAVNTVISLGSQVALGILSRDLNGELSKIVMEPPLDVRVRAWYNPDLVSAIFIVPGLIGTLLMQTTIMVMGIAIVREREKGTLEALIVSPIRRWELILGKILPNLVVSYGQITMALIVAYFVFDVPIRGSLFLLYFLSLIFMMGTLGIGILISTVAKTVPQAMQISFLTFLPSIYLSGLLFPIEGMPKGAQYIAHLIPLTYYLRIVRGIVLKGIGMEYLWSSVLPLTVFGIVVFVLAVLRFNKHLD